MTPGEVLVWIVVAVVCGFIGHAIGKPKGRASTGAWLGALLGVIGIIVIALMGRDREAEIREAQRQLEVQAEAARRAGYAYPPQGPDGSPAWLQGQPPSEVGPIAAWREAKRYDGTS